MSSLTLPIESVGGGGGGGGSGDVVGPSSSTDEAIVRFDGTTGKLIQDSPTCTINDSGQMGIGDNSFDLDEKLKVVGAVYTPATVNPVIGYTATRINEPGGSYVGTDTAIFRIYSSKTDSDGNTYYSTPQTQTVTGDGVNNFIVYHDWTEGAGTNVTATLSRSLNGGPFEYIVQQQAPWQDFNEEWNLIPNFAFPNTGRKNSIVTEGAIIASNDPGLSGEVLLKTSVGNGDYYYGFRAPSAIPSGIESDAIYTLPALPLAANLIMASTDTTGNIGWQTLSNLAIGTFWNLLSGNTTTSTQQQIIINTGGVGSGVNEVFQLYTRTNGSVLNGFGTSLVLGAESSTTNDQRQATIESTWIDPSHGTRKARLTLAVNALTRGVGLVLDNDGSNVIAGFGAVPTASTNVTVTQASGYVGLRITGAGSANMQNWVASSTVASSVDSAGNISTNVAGVGFKVKEGTNACMGAATLVGGTVTVSTTKVTANSRIFLTHQNNSGTVGFVTVSARSAGTSFTITSSSALDTSTIAWQIFEPS